MNKVIEVILPLPMHSKFDYSVPDNLACDVSIGKRVEVIFSGKKKVGFIYKIKEQGRKDLKPINKVLDKEVVISSEAWELAKRISKYYACSLGEALKPFVPKKWSVRQGKEAQEKEESKHQPFHKPTIEQKQCIDKIYQAIDNKDLKPFLLYGVASSGKTEIYFYVIKKILSLNKTAIYLVPEIALTPQIIEGLNERFGENIAVWHSNLSERERFIIWKDIKNGKVKILVGARSAIFAPFDNLGAIIIDEEHEDSFKQETKPCYDARLVALWRSKYHSAQLILGSATPSIETYYLMNKGQYQLLTLKEKVSSSLGNSVNNLSVKIVDMRKELDKKNFSLFSYDLYKAIKDRLEKKEQVILFLNRRGHTTYVFCRQCGFVAKCPNCGVSLVYHLSKNELTCHYCGYHISNFTNCPDCKSKYIKYYGAGIQKVEHELRKIFKSARIARLDQDITKEKGSLENIYNNFKKGNIDILLGTQIVAKGFDFKRVTLVGVISADTAINLPDFRSTERIYSLLVQVVGRSGRHTKGEALIQTYYPDHYSIINASHFNYNAFFEEEIKWRKELLYPPFSRLVNIVFRGVDQTIVEKEAKRFKDFIDKNDSIKKEHFFILGPSPALIQRMHGKYRYQMLVKEFKDQRLEVAYQRDWLEVLKEFKVKNGINVNIDIDPVSIM